ncbi:MAG: hypothetical protein HYW49_00055 [Deltaproteobacteria bacterium]|nr:hypothetical protein [Deltaproteobacteria bacterium]
MKTKLITSENQYREYLAEIERLVELDPKKGSPEGDSLALLSMLVQNYEQKRFEFRTPDPIEAIRFRMEEQSLSQGDLVPYIGSRSKVSEVLSGRRSLTLQMIRALNSGLGIPADILLKQTEKSDSAGLEYEKFPLREMARRGWISTKSSNLKAAAQSLISDFLKPLNGFIPAPAKWRKSVHERSGKEMDKYALFAWTARILLRADTVSVPNEFNPKLIDEEFLSKVVRLSHFSQGPLLARELLAKHGIILLIEPHLPKTRLDGAAILSRRGYPVVGLTLRYDRIDAFWYNLIHELVHVGKHLKDSDRTFFDDLDIDASDDPYEKEADRITRETLIPRAIWTRSVAFRQRTHEAVIEFAKKLEIHPAIVAGRIRYEAKNFTILNNLIGHGEVRRLFPETSWSSEESSAEAADV